MSILKRSLLFIIYFIVIIGLVFAIILAFNNADNTNISQTKNSPEKSQSSQSVTNNTQESGKSQAQTVAGSTITTTITVSSSGANANSTANQNTSQLSNTGPGSVVTLFMVSSLIGYFGYRKILVRRWLINNK